MTQVTAEIDLGGGVLVGFDGSSTSAEAVRWGARYAQRFGCRLHVVRCWSISSAPRPPSASVGYVPSLAEFEEAVSDRLRLDVEGLGLPDDVDVAHHVLHGAAGRRLIEASATADLLVVGARGEGGFHGLRFGSTADQVVRHASCPVVVVPPDAGEGADGAPTDPDSRLGI
ncbi:universal stress protein [Nocardioides sp. GCM10027113]|uniref:universal stress protein n=1 Tax=unclassified Nocardioides TaxID=2615069 RepID=UPI00361F474B